MVGNRTVVRDVTCYDTSQVHGGCLRCGSGVLQALVLASSVQMAHSALGNTPAIITPPFVSPATPNEPGATPIQVRRLL